MFCSDRRIQLKLLICSRQSTKYLIKPMRKMNRRELPRMTQEFKVKILQRETDFSLEGMTVNISQGGASIKTEHWRSLHVSDRAELTFYLPPKFTGQSHIIGLHGFAMVTRIDKQNESVAVKFVKSFRNFEPIRMPEVAGKIRYHPVSYYLSTFVELPLTEFKTKYPHGFIVERSQHFFDKTVIFQFITDVVEDQYVLKQLKQGLSQTDVLGARVIEIKKKPSAAESLRVAIGRSPTSDIVLYNRLVSRNHAYLQLVSSDRNCYLVDTESTNGTFLNGNRISPGVEYVLSNLDEISFGPETKVIYFSSGAFHSFLSKLKAGRF